MNPLLKETRDVKQHDDDDGIRLGETLKNNGARSSTGFKMKKRTKTSTIYKNIYIINLNKGKK